ncbi:MAG: flagellar basal body P-ring formation chaperone FlgA [Legionellales bacterium]
MKFVISLLMLLAVSAHAQNTMRFQAHSSIQTGCLGDLLLITPDKMHWSKIRLDSKPRTGEHISKDQIIDWLTSKVGAFPYKWKGKKSTLIQQVSQSSGIQLQQKAQTALSNQLKKQTYSQIELTPKTSLQDSAFPLSEFTVQVPTSYPTAKRVCVRLKHGKHASSIWFAVKAYKNVLVAQRALKKHTTVQQADFVFKKRNLAGLTEKPCTSLNPNAWLKNSMNKNQILTEDNLSTPPLVLRGHTVTVRVASKRITITTEAIAQKDGYLGEKVRMQNPKSHQYFVATITAKNQAERL